MQAFIKAQVELMKQELKEFLDDMKANAAKIFKKDLNDNLGFWKPSDRIRAC